jgi:phage anti-repressor protein
MEYFLELSDEPNDGKFVVRHNKLVDYGVTTNDRSGSIKQRLEALDLGENVDYIICDVQQQTPNGMKIGKTYLLTPDAFKLALMRAKKSINLTIDPRTFAKYYLFLEKVIKYYRSYQQQIADLDRVELQDENTKLAQKKHSLETTQDLILLKLDLLLAKNDLLLSDSDDTDQSVVVKKLDTVVDMLQQKCLMPKLHHNFVCIGHRVDDTTRKLVFIAGREVNVRATMRKHFEDTNHAWTVQISLHNTNPIELRNSIHTRISEHIKRIVNEENTRRTVAVTEHNEALKAEIQIHKRDHRESRRVYRDEKLTVTRMTRADIAINCTKTSLTFVDNNYFVFDELIELIQNANKELEKNPIETDNNNDE